MCSARLVAHDKPCRRGYDKPYIVNLMKSKKRDAAGLEAELMRLNELVRARRKQLARLDSCPHKDCECRAVWHEVVEEKLSHQVGKVRQGVRGGKNSASKGSRSKKATAKSKRG